MSAKENQQKSMMIVKGQSPMGSPTFTMIPVTESCPYVECIYIPERKQLAIISKTMKETFHYFPKLDQNGDVVKTKQPRHHGGIIAEERKQINAFYEYTIADPEEIKAFVDHFALDTKGFSIESFDLPTKEEEAAAE